MNMGSNLGGLIALLVSGVLAVVSGLLWFGVTVEPAPAAA